MKTVLIDLVVATALILFFVLCCIAGWQLHLYMAP